MAILPSDDQRWEDLALEAGRVFTPNTPVDERSLFSGRVSQIRRIVDAVNQRGQHAMLFGERGVGKTSLANVLSQFLSVQTAVIAPRVNCDVSDTFDSVWRKIFEQIEFQRLRTPAGFEAKPAVTPYPAIEFIDGQSITPETVRRLLTAISTPSSLPILIVDEFDRLKPGPRKVFADLIKTLSDHAIPATVVLVGVADTVDALIEGHQSVSRALVQIQMPRMSQQEIQQIIDSGVNRLGMTVDENARARIVLLSQGLPHYAHLVARHAARAAIDSRSLVITLASVNQAINKAIEDAQHSIRQAYHAAIRSARKDNLFGDVLLACALAQTDELGYFAAQDVRPPLRQISGKSYDIPTFAQHLNEFSDTKRGTILQKTGETRRYRYRFADPLMQPYVIMQGLASGRITEDALARTKQPSTAKEGSTS